PRSRRRFFTLVLAVTLLLAASLSAQTQNSSIKSNPADSNTYVGNAACAKCHASIFNTYQRTPMAHASGTATEDLKPADFVHKKSGVHYRIYNQNATAWLAFDRPGDPSVNGKRQLLYFIGSGHRGRSYLF